MKRPDTVVDPPKHRGQYVFQEECCWDLRQAPTVPARSLQMVKTCDGPYRDLATEGIEWQDFTCDAPMIWAVVTYPLWSAFEGMRQIPKDVQQRMYLLVNPGSACSWVREQLPDMHQVMPVETEFLQGAIETPPERLFEGLARTCRHTTLQVASGCPYGCRYCVWAGQKTRWADPGAVAYLSTMPTGELYLLAPQLTGSDEWAVRFCEGREKHGGGPPFKTALNCAHVRKHEESLHEFAAAGMVRACVGTEAFSESALERLGCPHTVEDARHMIRLLGELNVFGRYELRIGYGESLEEIAETQGRLVSMALTLKPQNIPHILRVGRFIYWPGTRLPMPESFEVTEPYGVPVIRERLDPEKLMAWERCFDAARRAGWKVVG